MTSPYTLHPLDAFMAAQTAVGLTLTAILFFRPMRPLLGTALMLIAIWLSITVPVLPELIVGFDGKLDPAFTVRVLGWAAMLASVAALLSARVSSIVVALGMELFLAKVSSYITHSEWELACVHLACFGAIVGMHLFHEAPRSPPTQRVSSTQFRGDDALLFVIGSLLATVVCFVVLQRFTNSGDEWAYTFQSAVFARGRAYADAPPCSNALQAFWVFEWGGKQFSQYTPGWPYFMAPFTLLRMPYMAGPVSLGLLVVGVARLARRAAFDSGFAALEVRASGWAAGMSVVLGSTYLINGGSRYPHIFVAALYAWAAEALFEMSTPGVDVKRRIKCGVWLGITAALLPATRPPDGFALGVGLFCYFAYALARRRIGLGALLATLLSFAAVAGLTLVVLRLQIGKWFVTGYSLNAYIHPWNKVTGLSVPEPDQFKWAFPLASGSYCWLPCAPALGLAGLFALRGGARRFGWTMLLSYAPFILFYTLAEVGRGFDLGFGPRYELPYVVPMAVGGGVLLGPVFAAARRTVGLPALRAGGPALAVAFVMILGVVRIAPLVYPYNFQDVKNHARLPAALRKTQLRNAVVIGGGGLTNTDPMDLPENFPPTLYPNEDVIIAMDRPNAERCLHQAFPKRTFYRAVAGTEVQLVPME